MTMDICYLDRNRINVSILNATATNLEAFTMATATLLERKAEEAIQYRDKAVADAADREYDAGYNQWKDERALEATRAAAEANQAVTDWGTFWHEHTNVTVSSMLMALAHASPNLRLEQLTYAQHLATEGIKVLRDQGDLNLRIL